MMQNEPTEPEVRKTENDTEKEIIHFLYANGPAYYGDILKALKLSYKKGQEHLTSLKSKGLIKQTRKPLKIEVNQ